MKSTALEVNLSGTRTHVSIDEKYQILLDFFQGYVGIVKRLETFLKELSHPYMNRAFVVEEARYFALHYFHLYVGNTNGPAVLALLSEILVDMFENSTDERVARNAANNLMLVLHHAAKETHEHFIDFLPFMEKMTGQIQTYEDEEFSYFVTSYYQPDRLGILLLNAIPANEPVYMPLLKSLYALLGRYYRMSFSYWLGQEDPKKWVQENIRKWKDNPQVEALLETVSHTAVRTWQKRLEAFVTMEDDTGLRSCFEELLGLVGFRKMVKMFGSLPRQILNACKGDERYGQHLKLTFLFYIIHVPGLSIIHKDALLDINRTLTQLIGDADYHNDIRIVDQTFALLKELKNRYPATVLECIHKIGDAVYNTREMELINHFIDRTVDHGFQFPMIQGTSEDWQIQGNMAHVKNVRVFMSLIARTPSYSRRLLSALIISLSIGGAFIRDTDLFPRDITLFLNAKIGPVYNLVKQLARLLPSFFNEIGAEGALRDVSTELDESCHRKDILIHFLRKQCHVESSSRIVDFIQQVILFWKTKDKSPLEPFIPPSIFREVPESGPFVDGPSRIFQFLAQKGLEQPEDFLLRPQNQVKTLIEQVEGVTQLDQSRVRQIILFYRLLNEKYGFDKLQVKTYLNSFQAEHLPDPKLAVDALEEKDLETRISALLDYMEELKSIILSRETYPVNEEIYYKRHIAVDIPSMYGSYSEAKFDALGLSLRLETIVNVFFEDLINSIDLRLITKPTFVKIYRVLELFKKALNIDGIVSNKFNIQMEFLKYSTNITTCSFTQYLDIFKGFTSAVADAVHDHFHHIHSSNLVQIEARIGKDAILPKYLPSDYEKDHDQEVSRALDRRMADIFFRDRIATSLGLQQLDIFLHRILNTLFQQAVTLSQDELSVLLNYDPKQSLSPISDQELEGQNIILLGNKGWNLIRLAQLGLPTPDGFIMTTEVFKGRDVLVKYSPARVNFQTHVKFMISELEKKTGTIFGNPKNPLLLSVRSGSSISQPGMLDSFLNVGINEYIAQSLAEHTQNPWFAWDCYRRFVQQYGMTFGLHRDQFDQIIAQCKEKLGIPFKRYFTGSQMKQVALAYKQLLLDSGIELIESPMDQLFQAIHRVFSSWDSPRARDYRRIMSISDDWGTAVTVQTMTFGNQSRQSGSGVVFSHSPRLPGDAVRPWGDFTIGNQGEDVVSGLVKTLPISEMQRELTGSDSNISLESRFPEIYEYLKKILIRLVHKERWNPQEIEFTFQGPEKKDLYILQARDLSVRDRKKVAEFSIDSQQLTQHTIGQGIGVSGGAMTGRVVFTLDEIDRFRSMNPEEDLIVLRNDTVPDDILEINGADGILTAKGGLTSHAAVVAYNLEKTCVVGCSKLICDEENRQGVLNHMVLKTGDNGLGRIGKLTLWHHVGRKFFQNIVVNIGRNPGRSFEDIVHYIERDSTYGRIQAYLHGCMAKPVIEDIDPSAGTLKINGVNVRFLRTHRNPRDIEWAEHDVQLVVDATGKFLDPEAPPEQPGGSLRGHLAAGVQKVVVSAPFKLKQGAAMPEDVVTTVMGINDKDYDPARHCLISNASCTTTCLAHMMNPLLDFPAGSGSAAQGQCQ